MIKANQNRITLACLTISFFVLLGLIHNQNFGQPETKFQNRNTLGSSDDLDKSLIDSELSVQNLFKISWENYQNGIVTQWEYINNFPNNKQQVYTAAEPFFSCPVVTSRVGGMDDGAKFVCGMNFLPKENCVIYSLGVSRNHKFEWALNKAVPQCIVYSFDPTPSLEEYFNNNPKVPPTQKHHMEAVTGKAGTTITLQGVQVKSRSLREIMKFYNQKEIHIFKIDIEGGEYELFENIEDEVWDNIHQIQVEVHPHTKRFFNLLRLLDQKGFVMFMKDPNLYCSGCFEFSFLNIKKFAALVGLDPSMYKTSLGE